ncbi:hypothetical protein C1H46_030560 [Malus baccata]|uniref:Uncharacterized protein n=1 Tax=Malus baccata TaxID=106549 RepID=A0A540LCA9_MALBA|nr:hypothetical protein C1H46_030560 [Malus baccata]
MPSLPAFSVTPAMVCNAVQSNAFVKASEWVEVQRSHICFLSGSSTTDRSGYDVWLMSMMGAIILHMVAIIFVVVLGGVVIGMVGMVVIMSVHGGRFGKDRRLRW